MTVCLRKKATCMPWVPVWWMVIPGVYYMEKMKTKNWPWPAPQRSWHASWSWKTVILMRWWQLHKMRQISQKYISASVRGRDFFWRICFLRWCWNHIMMPQSCWLSIWTAVWKRLPTGWIGKLSPFTVYIRILWRQMGWMVRMKAGNIIQQPQIWQGSCGIAWWSQKNPGILWKLLRRQAIRFLIWISSQPTAAAIIISYCPWQMGCWAERPGLQEKPDTAMSALSETKGVHISLRFWAAGGRIIKPINGRIRWNYWSTGKKFLISENLYLWVFRILFW